jgi:hypothetical protein
VPGPHLVTLVWVLQELGVVPCSVNDGCGQQIRDELNLIAHFRSGNRAAEIRGIGDT